MRILCCASVDDETARGKKQNKRIDQHIAKDNAAEKEALKLLLLGPGESGKSTLMKQMHLLYGQGFSESQRVSYKQQVFDNVLESLQTLILQSDIFANADPTAMTKIAPEREYSKQLIIKIIDEHSDPRADQRKRFVVTEEIADHISIIWADPGMQETYRRRAQFQLPDNTAYIFSRIKELAKSDYLLTDMDVLQARLRTVGVIQASFVINCNKFRVFDVGGQKGERRKWISCFDSVHAVIFVTAVSEYDQTMFEVDSHDKNRLLDAFELFQNVLNTACLQKTSMILFFNKTDLFTEKIKHVPLSVCFPEVDEVPDPTKPLPPDELFGGQKYRERCAAFLKAKFRSANQLKTRQIYTHWTCATDTKNCKVVFAVVQDIVRRASLANCGME